MAFNTGNNQNNNQTQPIQNPGVQGNGFDPNTAPFSGVGVSNEPNPTFTTQHADGTWSWGQFGGALVSAPIDAALSEKEKQFSELLEKINQQHLGYGVYPLDHRQLNNPYLNISGLVFTTTPKANKKRTALYVVFLEGSVPLQREATVPSDSPEVPGNVVIPITGDDYVPRDPQGSIISFDIAKAALAGNPEFEGVELFDAGCCVMPRHYEDNEETLGRVLHNAALASIKVLGADDAQIGNLSKLRKDSNVYLAQNNHVSSDDGSATDVYGNPIRAEVTSVTSIITNNGQNKSGVASVINSATNSTELTRVTAFFSVLNEGNPNAYANMQHLGLFNNMPQQLSQAQFRLNAVITSIKLIRPTLEALVLGLLNGSAFATKESVINTVTFPKSGIAGQSMDAQLHNIGGIGYMLPTNGNDKPQPMDTTPEKYNQLTHLNVLQTLFHKGTVLSIDVPCFGPDTYLLGILADLAFGSVEARSVMGSVLNKLFDGKFETLYQQSGGTGTYMIQGGQRVLLGSYLDKNTGKRRDLRDIDLLAVCNMMGENNFDVIRQFTQASLTSDKKASMAAMYRLLSSVLNDVQITGTAVRVTFEGAFLKAMNEAAIQCGYTIQDKDTFQHQGDTMLYWSTPQSAVLGLTNIQSVVGMYNFNNVSNTNNGYNSMSAWRRL